MPATLPISRLIGLTVSLSPQAAQAQNVSTLLVLGASEVIDVVARLRIYTTLAQVSTDFGTSAPEYLAALAWFSQNPQPASLLIGRWAQTASNGRLLCGALPTAQQAISFWNAITAGSFRISINGGAAQNITGLNFSAATNLNGVASIIQAALSGVTVIYNSVFNRFEFESSTTGPTSSISFLSATGTGTDISASLQATNASAGAYVANGIAAETAVSAVTLFDTTFGQQWYGLNLPTGVVADHLAAAAYIEGSATYHYYGITTQDPNTLLASSTTDLAFQLSQLAYNRTAIQYSSSSAYAVASLLARILTTNWQGNNTAITLFYKNEPGIAAETLNSTQIAALEAKNCNVFTTYNVLSTTGSPVAIIEPGVSTSGAFIDTVIGAGVLAITVQANLFNTLLLSPTKTPQTDSGMNQLVTVIEQTLSQFVTDGLLAPGSWTGPPFGSLSNVPPNNFMPKGYYVFAPPVAKQSAATRSQRISVPIQVAAKLGGAVHTAQVSITFNN